MKIGKQFHDVKHLFGDYLRSEREFRELSAYDLGYVMGISPVTWWNWEQGLSFPSSIIKLKKLHLLCDHIPEVLTGLFNQKGIAPNRRQWDDFRRRAFKRIRKHGPQKDDLTCCYQAVDERDDKYRIAFGKYLRNERLNRDVALSSLADALGVAHENLSRWESGTNFPSSPRVLMLLNKFFGDTISVLFGTCKEKGIHLERCEVREVMTKLAEFENTTMWEIGKSKPSAWAAYLERKKIRQS